MKVLLMVPDRDFAPEKLPATEEALTQDLELSTLWEAMALGDRFIYQTVKQVLLSSLDDLTVIRYRLEILEDCLKNPAVVRDIYRLPLEAIENKRKNWMGIFGHYPSGILSSAVGMLDMFVVLLKELKRIADEHAGDFHSEGFTRFFAMIQQELDDDYFAIVESHLEALKFRRGVLLSAQVGQGNEGTNHVLRQSNLHDQNWIQRALADKPRSYSFSVDPHDDHGARALGELKDRVINLVANAVAQSAEHIDSFFEALRQELAFYIGCLNLYERLVKLEEPVALPQVMAPGEGRHSFTGLYDACLALTMNRKVVGNEVNADGKDLVVITGANQGGKSTFLRSIGLAQLMMQCGMFVPAESFSGSLCDGLFTHYKREEDTNMASGKFDEELGRMSDIVDQVRPNSLVLFNESFAATNEREGSEIARQITSALLERHIRVFYVTHLYELAHGFYDSNMANALFLRAERQADGTRTFELIEGEPLETSYGKDLYHEVFNTKEPLVQAANPR
jgi:DNA mismatch repair ATPase MutS